ncbi:unnamed protein product [Coccothraustes coccothraustes]
MAAPRRQRDARSEGMHARLRGLPCAQLCPENRRVPAPGETAPRGGPRSSRDRVPVLGRRRRVRSGPASEVEVPRHREGARPQKSGRIFTERHILRGTATSGLRVHQRRATGTHPRARTHSTSATVSSSSHTQEQHPRLLLQIVAVTIRLPA